MSRMFLLFVFTALAALFAAAGPLDGRSIGVDFRDSSDKAQGGDQLIFANGTLALPDIGKRYAFAAAPYTAAAGKAGVATFSAELISGEHGNLAIAGTITKEGVVEGTRTWSKPGKEPIVHRFRSRAP